MGPAVYLMNNITCIPECQSKVMSDISSSDDSYLFYLLLLHVLFYGYFSQSLQRVPPIQCRAVINPTRAHFSIYYFWVFLGPPKLAGRFPLPKHFYLPIFCKSRYKVVVTYKSGYKILVVTISNFQPNFTYLTFSAHHGPQEKTMLWLWYIFLLSISPLQVLKV